MYDRPEEQEYINRPIGMISLTQQAVDEGYLKYPEPRANEDEFSQIQSFTDETGYAHQDLKQPLFGCC